MFSKKKHNKSPTYLIGAAEKIGLGKRKYSIEKI